MSTAYHAGPDWLKAVEARETSETLERDAVRQREAAAALQVKMSASGFFQNLHEQLTLAVAALDPTKRDGSVTAWGSSEYEQGVRVSIRRNGIIAKQTYTDLIYTKGQAFIRCNTVEGMSFLLSFCVNGEGEICVTASKSPMVMDHRQAARFIVEPMMNLTKL